MVKKTSRRSGSGKGRGRHKTALTMLNIRVVAPMPSASVTAAVSVKPGERRRRRTAYLMSWIRLLVMPPCLAQHACLPDRLKISMAGRSVRSVSNRMIPGLARPCDLQGFRGRDGRRAVQALDLPRPIVDPGPAAGPL